MEFDAPTEVAATTTSRPSSLHRGLFGDTPEEQDKQLAQLEAIASADRSWWDSSVSDDDFRCGLGCPHRLPDVFCQTHGAVFRDPLIRIRIR